MKLHHWSGYCSVLGNNSTENIQNPKVYKFKISDYRPKVILVIDSNVEKAFHCNYEDVDLEGLIEAKNKRWLDPLLLLA